MLVLVNLLPNFIRVCSVVLMESPVILTKFSSFVAPDLLLTLIFLKFSISLIIGFLQYFFLISNFLQYFNLHWQTFA
jgi:ABC-type sulfate transport system permease subunit